MITELVLAVTIYWSPPPDYCDSIAVYTTGDTVCVDFVKNDTCLVRYLEPGRYQFYLTAWYTVGDIDLETEAVGPLSATWLDWSGGAQFTFDSLVVDNGTEVIWLKLASPASMWGITINDTITAVCEADLDDSGYINLSDLSIFGEVMNKIGKYVYERSR